jgi:plastocyanin
MAALLLTSLISVLCLDGTAQADTYTIDVDAGGFDPGRIAVRLGDDVQWSNVDTTDHRARSDEHGFFDSGRIDSGQVSAATTFASAGTYRYHDTLQPSSSGVVEVPVRIRPHGATTPSPGALVRIRVADDRLPGRTYDLQRKLDHGDWTTILRRSAHVVVRMRPRHTGTFRFRARVHLAGTGAMSRWSPAVRMFVASPP